MAADGHGWPLLASGCLTDGLPNCPSYQVPDCPSQQVPDCPSHQVEATHASYDAAIDTLLLHCPCPERTSVMVASHNKASIERVAALLLGEYLGEGGGERSRVARERVYFGQLLGMGDNLTFTLARHALKAYKYVPDDPSREALPWPLMATGASRTASLIAPLIRYVPYGPIREVLPYLIRRAQENADALSGAKEQRNMMLAEVRRRALDTFLF